MNEFVFYIKQGIHHITDFQGIDHMLFVITLCAVYKFEQWRNIVVLISAFTIGHSITLAFTSLNIITIDKQLVEVLIPITILITCIFNVFRTTNSKSQISLNYLLALFFGLIHGMGFSTFFKSMMMGISDSIVLPLLSFNIGIELGQLMIIAVFILFLLFFTKVLKVKHREWMLFISGAGAGMAMYMIVKAFPWK
jgi:hypothetical protein